ncbi:MAG: PQQ-binding-like beta-propeller repeat protein [Mangrovicoccus sp.]
MREVDPNSGSLIRVTELPGPAAMDPIVVGGTLYIMTADGVLHAYR